MGNILFLSQRIPYPPDKGDKIRSWRALKHLAQNHTVHLGTFIDDPQDFAHVGLMETICETVHIARLSPGLARVRSLKALVTGQPLSLPYFHDAGLKAWVRHTLETCDIDTVFIFSSAMAQYVMEARGPTLLMDFVDVDSEKFRQYASQRGLLSKLVYGREAKKLLAFDARVAARADASFFVSDAEAALFKGLVPQAADKVFGLSNGIDTEYFDPALVTTPKSALTAMGPGPNIIFTGRMDYKPNIDAVVWFCQHVLPGLISKKPQTRFIIAGAAPTPAVVALGRDTSVEVTGRVEDMRPFLAHADLAVAPMAIGRGIQNKVLEAAAMARPVLTTPQGLEGIDLEPETHLYVASGAEDFLAKALSVLDMPDNDQTGLAARAWLQDHYSWPARLARLDDYLPAAPGTHAS